MAELSFTMADITQQAVKLFQGSNPYASQDSQLQQQHADGAQWAAHVAQVNAARVAQGNHLWSAAAQKLKPVSWERVAVVGEELGTQRDAATVPIPVFEDTQAPAATLTAALAQLRRHNADLVQQALARGAEVEQLKRDNELLVQLANDTAAAHVAELAKLMASAAQAPQTPPVPTPRDPWENALKHQRQVVGLLTEKPA